ncbi:MAG: hypothetical protein NZ750_12865 [Anaerolineae bacterium]|nr:hypothetical protein [Anaerolineae bacterium]MDW8173667.1 hypothetical protein [Anaerolineae bacterium]
MDSKPISLLRRGPWWRLLWLERIKDFFGQQIYHEAQTEIRRNEPGVSIEELGYKIKLKHQDVSYQIRVEPPSFDEALWSPVIDDLAKNPKVYADLLDDRGDSLERVFRAHGGEVIVDRALAVANCKCGAPRCVHRAMALIVLDNILSDSVRSFLSACGCDDLHLLDQMYRRGIDPRGRRGGPEVEGWLARQRAMQTDFWGGQDAPHMPEFKGIRAEVPPLPLEMDTFMNNLRAVLSKKFR